MNNKKIYLVAGEPSGDLLASGLMAALKRQSPDVEFRGIGGESMIALGFSSLFDISEISVMGFFEVIPRLPLILKRLKQTIIDIEQWQPDVIVTVDSWGFVSSLAGRLRKKNSNIPLVHYVAPQVWAWKKGRAKKVAKLVDHLMTLMPEEGRYFEKYGLKCDFVGHPVIERISDFEADQHFCSRYDIPQDATIISLLPGSRRSEINRMLPVFIDSLEIINREYNNLFVLIPSVDAMKERIAVMMEGASIPYRLITGKEDRYNAFNISKIAIAKSGTVSLELTAMGVPHLIAYKFNSLTNILARLFVKVRMANLINLIDNRIIIPEFLLPNCKPDKIASCALQLIQNEDEAQRQVKEAREVLQRLRLPDILPSDRAAQIVLSLIIQDL